MSSPAIKRALVEIGRTVIQSEARVLSLVAEEIGADFETACNLVLKRQEGARIIVSGMGKAGFVAMKISATLASTGVHSFFLHPAEALHGDLGRYAAHDIALILSYSGETDEIVRILAPIKRMGCALISITSSKDSTLSKHSDVTLELGKIIEADPNGLAPTASTTAMLALGDALAIAVLEHQGLSREQFALFHPGGNLGRRLTIVSAVMRRDEEHAIATEEMKTRNVIHLYTQTKGRPGAATIVDRDGKVVGIFTDGNLRRCIDHGVAFLDQPISAVMTKAPKTISESVLVEEALHVMTQMKIDQLIVIDNNNRPVGLVDIQDIVDIRL